MIATRIVELSKKNRVLMAESEGAKTRVRQLSNRIQELEQEVRNLRCAVGSSHPTPLLQRGNALKMPWVLRKDFGSVFALSPSVCILRGECWEARKKQAWRDNPAHWRGCEPGA